MNSIWEIMNHASDNQGVWLQVGAIFEFFSADVEIYCGSRQEAEMVWKGLKWVSRADFKIRFRKELVLLEELE